MREQFEVLVIKHEISLAVPIETRVKDWHSVKHKLDRKARTGDGLNGIDDLAGVRLITLFQEDVETLDNLIREIFDVTEAEDAASRLDDAHFGYRSNHYILTMPKTWESLPSHQGLCDMRAEIQVRTLPQHMWAAASHKLQYKREASVPLRLRRSINRVAAILETVDLEFSRMLLERKQYKENEAVNAQDDVKLNVDNLEEILNEIFPHENQYFIEDYDILLDDLREEGIDRVGILKDALLEGREAAIREDQHYVAEGLANYDDDDFDRYERGVYFTHVGLARSALKHVRGR